MVCYGGLGSRFALEASACVKGRFYLSDVDRIAEVLARKGAQKVAYFHTDHFEPWHVLPEWNERFGINRHAATDAQLYASRMSALPHARRLTLFYLPWVNPSLGVGPLVKRAPNDPIGIVQRTPLESELAQEAFEALLQDGGHEIQVHIHHEHLTYNDKYFPYREVCNPNRSTEEAALDLARFDLTVQEVLSRISEDTGRSRKDWFFVHGVWALNGSDRDVCQIDDEIGRLRQAGCLGDFSFPAGRPHCDPDIKAPTFVRTDAIGPKAYALGEADPVAPSAIRSRAASVANRFLIWNHQAGTIDSSLDFFDPQVAANLSEPCPWLARLLDGSFIDDGVMYVKTHAHSLNTRYIQDREAILFPHEHPGLIYAMTLLQAACDRRLIPLEYVTVSEVYSHITGLRITNGFNADISDAREAV